MTCCRYRLGALLAGLMTLGLGCGDDDGASMQAQTAQPLSCAPMTPRECPCVYGPPGVQMCMPSGVGFGACQGCTPPPQQDREPAPAIMQPAPSGPEPEDPGPAAMPTPDAGQKGPDDMPDSGMASPDGSNEPTVMAGMEGTSCGVGLPALCALESEKCCVRSLETDTCIEASAACECGLRDCSTLEAYCDGPEDCPDGQVCCGTLGGGFGGNTYEEFRCATSCDYSGSQRIACHQGEAECPGGNVCANSQLLTNLQVCIDPSSIEQ